MRDADLHLHTNHSDGTRTPKEVIDLAVSLDLRIIAISDHDNLGAFFEISHYAEENGVMLIPATELSCEVDRVDIHVLAYGFDPTDEAIGAALERFREVRTTRGHRMVEKLIQLGYPVRSERVAELAAGGSMGRPHVARALVEVGAVSSIDEAFQRLLTPGRPAYVPKARFQIADAVRIIRAAGGVTSVAHPSIYPDHARVVRRILEQGVDGVEVYHPQVDEESRAHYLRVAKELGKFVTGGSDDHGAAKTEETIGTIRVPEETLRPMLERIGRG